MLAVFWLFLVVAAAILAGLLPIADPNAVGSVYRAEPGTGTDETVILSVLDQFLAEGVSLQSKDARGFGPLLEVCLDRLAGALAHAGTDLAATTIVVDNATPFPLAL